MNDIALAFLMLMIPQIGVLEAAKACAFVCPSLSIAEIVNMAEVLA
jgi:nucleoside recognition membrane protein YjiH